MGGLAPLVLVMLAAPPPADAHADQLRAHAKALRKRDFAAARVACRAALAAASEPDYGGPRTAAAHAACAKVEAAEKRWRPALRAARAAAHASVHSPKARRQALAKRRSIAHRGKARGVAKRVTKLLVHDARLARLVRRPPAGAAAKSAIDDLLEARRAYREDRDGAQARRTDAVRALVLAGTKQHALATRLAKPLAEARHPPGTRRLALRALARAALTAARPDEALAAAIRLDDLDVEGRSEAQRRAYRSSTLKRACRAVDAAEGAGACARQQARSRGFVAFENFSRRRVKGALSQAHLDDVHADAVPALEECVLALAREDPERYRGEHLTFSWTIKPDGTPAEVEVRPRRHEQTSRGCIEGTIAWIRYPRTSPSVERRNVQVPFQLQ